MTKYDWINTNRLLGSEFDCDETFVEPFKGTLGCKTGITPSAGPCFSGAFRRKFKGDLFRVDNCIVVVLNSKTSETRW